MIFRDDALTAHNLQMDKLDIEGINLDAELLNENIDLRESNLLDDASIISQVNILLKISNNFQISGIKFELNCR